MAYHCAIDFRDKRYRVSLGGDQLPSIPERLRAVLIDPNRPTMLAMARSGNMGSKSMRILHSPEQSTRSHIPYS